MNTELVTAMAEFIMDRIAEWSMALTFEEHALLMQQLTKRIRMSLNAWEEMLPGGRCCYWESVPGETGMSDIQKSWR
jgi:hypothetical protein